jgi:DNA-binding response OmpR family regulator
MNKTNETNNERPMKKILIVEDDQDVAKALAVRLKSAGYEVTVAPDAMTGVAAARKIQPDLALLDISLPAGNGFTVAEKIRELLVTATPIIFLTASKKPGLRQVAQNLGAAFFEKPYDADELLAAIRYAFGELPSRAPATRLANAGAGTADLSRVAMTP